MSEKKKPVNAATDKLAALNIGESTSFGGMTYLRVPGGFVAVYGSAAAFVPLNELACGELGITFTDETDQ